MRSIFTWGRIGAVSGAAIVLILLYLLVVRTSDSPALSANEATRIAAEYMSSEHGGSTGCGAADFDPSRDVWEVSCEYADPDRCERDAYSISCGQDAMISEAVLVDDQAAQVYEPR